MIKNKDLSTELLIKALTTIISGNNDINEIYVEIHNNDTLKATIDVILDDKLLKTVEIPIIKYGNSLI